MTDISVAPQLLHPVTRSKSSAARIYAKPAYSVHMTRTRLDRCRRISLVTVVFWIFVERAESVFSKDAASSLDCSLVSNPLFPLYRIRVYLKRPKGHHGENDRRIAAQAGCCIRVSMAAEPWSCAERKCGSRVATSVI
jgi:hypothetical protein